MPHRGGVGGGLYISSFASVNNTTITNNTAEDDGSGVYVISTGPSGSVRFKQTIIASNAGSSNCVRVTPITSDGHNLDGGDSCGFTSTGDKQNTNPLLASLADNGGPTKTHALQTGSPAIDGGTHDGCPSTDQRGIQRPRDGDNNTTTICDIGAFEAPGTLGTPPDNNEVPLPDNDEQDEDNEVPVPEPDNDAPGLPGQTVSRYEMCPGVVGFPVRSITGFSIGDTVRINSGGQNQEDARIVDVGCDGTNLHLAEALKFRHQANESVVVVGGEANTNTTSNNDRNRDDSKPKTDEQRQQAEQTNRSGRDDVHTEGDVAAVDLSKQPPEIVILTRDGRQTVQLLCGGDCPTIRPGDYVQVEGVKEHEGLFYAEVVTVTRR